MPSDYNKDPGVVCLLTGDGKGFADGVGFHADLERMYKKGWGMELLAWEKSCNHKMRDWAKGVGVFVPLEDFYQEITFQKSSLTITKKGSFEIPGRNAAPLEKVNHLREKCTAGRP